MDVRLVLAAVEHAWFARLARQPGLDEVNLPSRRTLPALRPGELVLFLLGDAIAGGGVFAYASTLPCSVAWDCFGPANGAASLDEMGDGERDAAIRCCILSQPFFFAEPDRIRVARPARAARFTICDTAGARGAQIWAEVQRRLSAPAGSRAGFADEARRFGHPTLIRPRLGQGAFRVMVTDLYGRRCAVTAENTLPALEAAHIRPFACGGEHRPDNGILLRRDIHRLFDLGYVTVTPDLRFAVSRCLRQDYDGRAYTALDGREIAVPGQGRPASAALAWHNEHLFLGR
ncbi:MAG: HNH endonuclease [Alphaproteobacteria bacterium]|nr:HNH endonuclease [Alphaproteobacteria bacterium]